MFKLLKERFYSTLETCVSHETFLINTNPIIMKKLCERDPKYLKYAKGKSISTELIDTALNQVNNKDYFILNEILYQGNPIEYSSTAMKYFCEINGTYFTASHGMGITFENFLIAINHPDFYKRLELESVIGRNKFVFLDTKYEDLKKFCEYDGRFLYGIRSKNITTELLNIALNHPDHNKRPDLQRIPVIRSNPNIMKDLIELDGQYFIYALNEAANVELLNKALNHPDESKRLSFDRIPKSFSSYLNYSLIKPLIDKDERWIKYAYIDTLDSKGLIQKIKVDLDYVPSLEIIEKFKNDQEVLKTIYEEIEKGRYTTKQITGIFAFSLDNKIINNEYFLKITKYLCEKNDVNHEFFIKHINKSLSLNNEILITLNLKFLQERYHKIYEDNDFEKLYFLAIYPDIQDSIIRISKPVEDNIINYELGDKKLELLSKILKLPTKHLKGQHQKNWQSYYIKVINSFEQNPKLYNNLSENISKIDEKLLKKIASYSIGQHPFKIKNIDEFKRYDEIRNQWIEKNIKSNKIDEVREAVLEKVFGISLNIAKEFHIPYTEGILKGKDYFHPTIVEFFTLLNQIMNEDKIDNLKDNLSNKKSKINLKDKYVVDLRGIIKKQYLKSYNDTLFKIGKEKPDDIIKGIKLYKAAGPRGNKEFNISLTALGAYTGFDPLKEGYNYKDDWNRPKILNHGICTSYIGNNSIGVAQTHYSILGFTDYDDEALLLSGPSDIYSINESFDIIGDEDAKSRYLMPSVMLDETRHNHNEMVMERREGNEKRKPSYVVLVCDDYSQVRRNYLIQKKLGRYSGRRDNLYGKEHNKGDLLYHALDTAKDFDIPIVIVEREKIALNEYLKIRQILNEFKAGANLNREKIKSYFYSLITNYENNYSGNALYHRDINQRFFSKNHAESILEDIEDEISFHLKHNPITGFIMLEELENITNYERRKLKSDNTLHAFNYDSSIRFCNSNKEYFLNQLSTPENIYCLYDKEFTDDNFLMEYNEYLDSVIRKEQITPSSIKNLLTSNDINQITVTSNEIDRLDLYEDSSKRHIENVLLFSMIIAKNLSLSKSDIDILLLAALYHDYEKSSLIPQILKRTNSLEDIKMVEAIISYNKKQDELKEICEELNIDIKKEHHIEKIKILTSILKDADNLDRTRFFVKDSSFIKPSNLHHPISYQLIKFGMQLNECYALNDIKNIKDETLILEKINQIKSPKLISSIYKQNKPITKKIKRK